MNVELAADCIQKADKLLDEAGSDHMHVAGHAMTLSRLWADEKRTPVPTYVIDGILSAQRELSLVTADRDDVVAAAHAHGYLSGALMALGLVDEPEPDLSGAPELLKKSA